MVNISGYLTDFAAHLNNRPNVGVVPLSHISTMSRTLWLNVFSSRRDIVFVS